MTKKNDGTLWVFAGMIYFLAFQKPLEGIWAPFSYIDEVVALTGILWVIWKAAAGKCFAYPKYLFVATAFLAVFSAAGLAGNILYRYQPWKSVLIDLYTNLKFFFAILAGYALCENIPLDALKNQANHHGRVIVAFLFAVFVLDRIFGFWPGSVRYGLRTAILFYGVPTYLAGAAAFLLALLTAFYEKKNIPFLAMGVILLMFTLRSKAIASGAAFVGLFLFFVLLKRRVKLWHILLAGLACVVVAWPQIRYYFIELGGKSTRSVMHSVAFQIAQDYFPIGTGFGTYASSEAEKVFSPVYEIYNFEYLLRFEKNRQWLGFLNDTFWPIIIGQTGAIGTAAYVSAQGILFGKSWQLQKHNLYAFAAVLYGWGHLLICSIAEPAFNNSTAIPFAIITGIALWAMEKNKFAVLTEKEI